MNIIALPVALIIASLIITGVNAYKVIGREAIVRWLRPNHMRPLVYSRRHSWRALRHSADRISASSLTLQLFHERAWRTELGKAAAPTVSLVSDMHALGVVYF